MKIADLIRTFKKHRDLFFCHLLKLRKFVNFVVLDLKCQSPFRYVCVQSSKLRTFTFFLLVRRYNGTVERLTKHEKVEFDRICSQMLHVQSSMKDYILLEN